MAMSSVRRRVGSARVRAELLLDRSYPRLARHYEFPDGSHRVYCHHIRKTAGTSLHNSFIALGGEDPMTVQHRMEASRMFRTKSGRYIFATGHRIVLERGDYFYGWSHLPAHQVALPPRTFTVTVLRDPVARVVSFYKYLVAGDAPATPFNVAMWERRLADDGFGAFLDRVPRRSLLAQLYTFSARYDVSEAADTLRACSFVLSTEAFDKGIEELGSRLALPLLPRHERVTPTAQETSHPSEAELLRLRELLEPEYQLLAQL